MCVSVCVTNWTGIVVGAEEGPGKERPGWGGGVAEKALAGGPRALGEQQFLTSKKAYRVDKR